ncbi:MAG: hypothetical protein WAN70_08610 [Terriglobales bacterium]
MLAVIAVYFYHLREVCLSCEYVLNALPVEVESISGDLETVLLCHAITKASQELIRGFAVTLPHSVGRNQFRIRVQCDEDPSISGFWRIVYRYPALFLLAECPNFVALNPLALEVLHLRFHESYAALSSENQETENRIAVQSSDALGAANTGAFDEELNRQQRFIFRHCHGTKQADVIFRVGLAAQWAPITLETISVFPETPAFDLALLAIHVTTLQQAPAVVNKKCSAMQLILNAVKRQLILFNTLITHMLYILHNLLVVWQWSMEYNSLLRVHSHA